MTATPSKTDIPVKVIVHEDTDEVTIEWDETHPLSISLGLDKWTPDQWLDAMESGFKNMVEAADEVALNEG
jgi:hypothetical protein